MGVLRRGCGCFRKANMQSEISVTDCDSILGGVSVLGILCKSSTKVLFLILQLNNGVLWV